MQLTAWLLQGSDLRCGQPLSPTVLQEVKPPASIGATWAAVKETITCWSMSACCCWSRTWSCWGVSTCCWRICCICWGVITWGVIIATDTGTWRPRGDKVRAHPHSSSIIPMPGEPISGIKGAEGENPHSLPWLAHRFWPHLPGDQIPL